MGSEGIRRSRKTPEEIAEIERKAEESYQKYLKNIKKKEELKKEK